MQKQRPIAEAKNGKNSKPPRAERKILLTFFLLKESMRAARAIVKTQIAGVTISMHHEDTEHVMIYFPGLTN